MNPKAKVYLDIHRIDLHSLTSAKKPNQELINNNGGVGSSRRFGLLFLLVAKEYIRRSGTDETFYWFSFVYDLTAAMGVFPKEGIYLCSDSDKKRSILEFTVLSGGECDSSTKANSLEDCLESVFSGLTANARVLLKNCLLTYAYNLISIDRRIDNCEREFYGYLEASVQNAAGIQTQSNIFRLDGRKQLLPSECITTAQASDDSIDRTLLEVESLIGLSDIKTEIRSLVNVLTVQKLRIEQGLPDPGTSMHMVFYGNPGTGKTTIARKLGEIYKRLGILSKGHFIEADRSALVAGYLGQTALKTTDVLTSALGGILFIDEAYSLARSGHSDQYGEEAISTILKFMEDHRDDIVIIVAGYKDLMAGFLDANPGLRSRFNKYLSFNDYTDEELAAIFLLMARESHYDLTPDAERCLLELCKEMHFQKGDSFGNGRTVRNLFEKTLRNQANRIVGMQSSGREALSTIDASDLRYEDMLEVIA